MKSLQRLGAIAKSEGLKITDGALVLLAREADGSMRDAQSLLEQVLAFAEPSDGKGKQATVDETSLQEVLGLAERRVLYEISAAVLGGDARKCLDDGRRSGQPGARPQPVVARPGRAF